MSEPEAIGPVASHPEEFRVTYDYRVGKSITLRGTARMTPAGLVTLAIAVSSILLSVTALVRARQSR